MVLLIREVLISVSVIIVMKMNKMGLDVSISR